MSSADETVTWNLEINMGPTYSELRKVETIIMRSLSLIGKFGFGTEINQVIQGLQKLMMTIRMLQITIHAFEIASGPIGWAYAGVTAVSTVVTLAEMG